MFRLIAHAREGRRGPRPKPLILLYFRPLALGEKFSKMGCAYDRAERAPLARPAAAKFSHDKTRKS